MNRDRQGDTPSTGDLLKKIEEMEGEDQIPVGEITEVIGGRAHGLVLLILSLPETIPMVGLSAILAAPILILGVVLVIRGADPPVPEWVRRRSLPRKKVQGAIRRTRPVVRWLDRVVRPRWNRLATAGRLQGTICIVMALLLAIPIPGVNILAAAAVAGVGLGILQRDGLVIAMAAGAALLALLGFSAVVAGAWGLLGR
ncbi:MAG: exopolysaccharide biosynthesis protein [Gemmatimonadales bacterium]|nr:MAG: exopolysaccharide biosynthesis protein [Gemmatimonadales bacterium]